MFPANDKRQHLFTHTHCANPQLIIVAIALPQRSLLPNWISRRLSRCAAARIGRVVYLELTFFNIRKDVARYGAVQCAPAARGE